MHNTLKACIRIVNVLTLCSLSRMRYMDRVKRVTKVSRSEVVTNILPSFSFNTLHIVSIAIWIWTDESHVPSFGLDFVLLDLPAPRLAGAAAGGRSASFVSTAERVHCSKKPYISRSCLWCCTTSVSSDSRS